MRLNHRTRKRKERGETCRVALCELNSNGTSRVVAVVRDGTQGTPFEWIATKDYDRIVLRINDSDGDFAANPDGNVRYRLRLRDQTVGPG